MFSQGRRPFVKRYSFRSSGFDSFAEHFLRRVGVAVIFIICNM
jgi:hypothetical protein